MRDNNVRDVVVVTAVTLIVAIILGIAIYIILTIGGTV